MIGKGGQWKMIKLNELEKAWISNHSEYDPVEMERLLNECEFKDLGEAMKQAEMMGFYKALKEMMR